MQQRKQKYTALTLVEKLKTKKKKIEKDEKWANLANEFAVGFTIISDMRRNKYKNKIFI